MGQGGSKGYEKENYDSTRPMGHKIGENYLVSVAISEAFKVPVNEEALFSMPTYNCCTNIASLTHVMHPSSCVGDTGANPYVMKGAYSRTQWKCGIKRMKILKWKTVMNQAISVIV